MQAVVLAGGKGTRLAGATGDPRPKALTPLAGLTVLDHILAWLAACEVRDVLVCTGYRAEDIEQHAGAGERYGLRVRYSREHSPLGTAGAVKAAEALLEERFVVVYGDVIADVDVAALWQAHCLHGALATLAVHPNDHPLDSDRVVADEAGRVERFVRKEDRAGPEAGALCNAALYVCERALLEHVPADGVARDFARDVFPAVLRAGGALQAYRTAEYLKDMGTPERRARVERELERGVPRAMRRSEARAAVLIDRDGVLVEDAPFIRRADELAVLPGVGPALARLNRAHRLAVCCTNQPVVARGDVSEAELHAIHRHMEGLLGGQGAWLDGIFHCPHHPHAGYAGERRELKIACACRKPEPGLVFAAEAALGVDRARSVFVGDRSTDLLAARRAGVLAVGVRTGAACADGKHPIAPEVPVVADLAEVVALLLDTAPSWSAHLDAVRRARVVLVGGPSRAGKTMAAAALRLALAEQRVPVLQLSLDRFILPASQRRAGSSLRERTRFDDAARAIDALVAGRAALVPGYDPRSREAAPSEVFQWSGAGVLLVDGLLATELSVPGALRVALHAGADDLRARREAFYAWKGLSGAALADALDGRAEEHATAAAGRADLVLELGAGRALRPIEAPR